MKNNIPRLIEPIGHTKPITSVAFSPEGNFVLTGSVDGAAKLWSPKGKEICTFEGHYSGINGVAFSPTRQQIATGSYDENIVLWDLMTGEELNRFRLKEQSQPIHSLAFSPDGTQILAGGKKGQVCLWKIPVPKKEPVEPSIFDLHQDTVNRVVFAPNGKLFASASADQQAVLVDLATQKTTVLPHDDKVKDIDFSPDNKMVVTGCTDGTIVLWKVEDGSLIHKFKGHDKAVFSVAFSKDSLIASGSTDKTVVLWKWEKRRMKKIQTFSEHEATVRQVAFSPDGKRVLSGSDDKKAILWNIDPGKKVAEFKGHSSALLDTSFSPDGLEILTGSTNSFAFLWDLKKGEIRSDILRHEDDKAIRRVAYSKDGAILFTGSTDKFVKRWDGTSKRKLLQAYQHGTAVYSMAVARDQSFLVSGTNSRTRNIMFWDSEAEKEAEVLRSHRKTVLALAISPDQKFLLSGASDHKVLLWNTKTKTVLKELTAHEGAVRAVAFSPDGKLFLSGSSDNTAILWNTRSRRKKKVLKGHSSDIYDVAFSPDGEKILTASKDKHAILWDLKGKVLQTFTGHKATVSTVSFSPNGRYVLTGSHDCTLKIWDIESGAEIASLIQVGTNDWVVTTPSGLFDASPGAMKLMHYVVGREVIELDQLKERYWQPGLLTTLLDPAGEGVKDVEAFKDVPLYPIVLSAGVKDDILSVKIKERNGGIGRISLRINNKEQERDIREHDDKKHIKTEISLSLKKYERFFEKGENTISIRCWNEEGWLPGPYHELAYSHQERAEVAKEEAALYALFVGTSKYRNPDLSLSFPDQDATYLNDAVAIVGRHLFKDKIHTRLLTTDQSASDRFASKENIQKAFEELAGKAKPQDVVFIYFSGHGANYDNGQKAQYYYLTHEIVTSNLSDSAVRQKGTISSDELTGWINRIPARKQVLVFDTCYSGKIMDSLKSKNAIDSTRDRAMERMKDRTGMYVLTGSAADKVSYEASNYGQGLLTYTLLQGMRGAALLERINQPEKSVDVMTLFSHSREEVERLSREFSVIQRPALRAPLNVESFDIGIAPESARRQIQLALPKPVFERSNFMNEEDFLDDLDLSETLDQYLSGSIGIGHRPQAIFIDVVNFPGAHNVRGLYKKTPDGYVLRGKVFKDKNWIGDFEVAGSGTEDIIPRIAREVEQIAFQYDDYEIPTDEEIGVLEKGRKEDLEELKGKPGYGYDENFIGKSFKVPLPALNSRQKRDIAKSTEGDKELHYQYYSVVQSRSRKFPYFAACNLHGGEFRKLGRAGAFIRDPRLPKEYQWDDDFYVYQFKGKNKKSLKYTKIFHRGHMAKREDTQWGKTNDIAEQGAKLTFFFTNAIPQHGHLNGVVWRGLEDYIMHVATDGKKARGDDGYKINIFTGPVFRDDDPKLPIEVDGKEIEVPVPVLFWKVVYFKKKDDDKLYSVGFMMGQRLLLEEAFGRYGVTAKDAAKAKKEPPPFMGYKDREVFQVKVSFIEEQTKMKFHPAIDPMKDSDKGQQISEVVRKVKKKGGVDEPDGLGYGLDGLML